LCSLIASVGELGCVIAEEAPRLLVMELNIFLSPADLATPAVTLQDFTALCVQARPFGSNSSHGAT
jgi:hypothetical protein